jgi:hypothetical protein
MIAGFATKSESQALASWPSRQVGIGLEFSAQIQLHFEQRKERI